MSGSMQDLVAQARAMIVASGAPVNAENLNRAMLMLAGSGDVRTEQTAEGFDMNAQVDRVMQRSTGRPTARANVPRNAQPSTPVGGASQMPPDENAQDNNADLPMPPPDVRDAARETGQREMIIPGEGIMYTPANAPTSSLDGNGWGNRFLRDLVMGAESAGAVSGMLPPVGGATASGGGGGGALPNIRLGMNRPQLPGPAANVASVGDDAAGTAVAATPRPALPGSGGTQAQLPAPQQALPAPQAAAPAAAPPSLSPAQQRALAGPDLPPGTPTGLTPRQRATLMGPGQAGDAAFRAARVREGGPRGVSSATRQRASNRSNASN